MFLIAVLIIMLAIQSEAHWLVVGMLFIIIISMRTFVSIAITVVTIGLLYYIKTTGATNYWPVVIFGALILLLAFGSKKGAMDSPEYYAPDMDMASLLGGGH